MGELVTVATPPQSTADTLWLPTLGKSIPRPWFLPSADVLAEQRRILESTYFLVSIRGTTSPLGEWLRCDPKKGGCGGKHEYITLRCVSQPFSGVTGGLFAYWRAVGDNGLVKHLSPEERTRFDAIGNALGGIPDLAASHPDLARSLTRGLAPSDAQIGAVALGILEPIPVSLARKYRDRIRARGARPRFNLPGMPD